MGASVAEAMAPCGRRWARQRSGVESGAILILAGRLSAQRGGREDLSPVERARAAALHRELDRQRYLGGRWLLRRALELGGRDPREAAQAGPLPPPGCSLSRSGDLGVVAISDGGALGIDAEVAERWPLAAEALARVDHAGAAAVWVRVEAVLKALGTGLSAGLPRGLAGLCASPGIVEWAGTRLEVTDLEMPGALAALAAPPGASIRRAGGW
jgi:hypothetical protein